MDQVADGVPCEPGSVIHQSNGTQWICDEMGFKYHKVAGSGLPDCQPGETLAWDAKTQLFTCITDNPIQVFQAPVKPGMDPLWIIFWMAIVFAAGSLALGLTQWWRNRKAKMNSLEVLKAMPIWENILGKTAPVMTESVKEETKMADPTDKNPNSLQDEIKDIYMELQMGRSEVAKISGMVQVYVNSAMRHFDEAVKKVSALGGKVK